VERFHILPKNTYNFDEKGFLIGLARKCKRIMTTAQLLMKQLMGASQDGNRENIILMTIICADGSRISPGLIYQSEAGLIQNTWLNDFDENGEVAYFAVTQKEWTNENVGLYWLEHIFDRHTKIKAGNHRCLLIVDGHNSHVNMRFINYCDQNRILLTILPPHSTHLS
jgi:DDE superfamily endonuclease